MAGRSIVVVFVRLMVVFVERGKVKSVHSGWSLAWWPRGGGTRWWSRQTDLSARQLRLTAPGGLGKVARPAGWLAGGQVACQAPQWPGRQWRRPAVSWQDNQLSAGRPGGDICCSAGQAAANREEDGGAGGKSTAGWPLATRPELSGRRGEEVSGFCRADFHPALA